MPVFSDRPLRILQVAIVVLPLVGAALWGWMSWATGYEAAVGTAKRNADLVREYTLRLIQTQRVLLDAADAYVSTVTPAMHGSRATHEFLARIEAGQSFTFGLGVVDATGRIAASSRSWPVSGNVSDRTYFARHRDGEDFFVDRILLQLDGQDAFVISQRRRGEPFGGLLVSAVDVAAITDFLRTITDEEGSSASLLRADGMLLVRNFPSPPMQLPPDQPIFAAIRSSDTGTFETRARTDNVVRIYAFSRIGDLPLYANFGVSKDTLLKAFAVDFGTKALFLAAITVVGLLALRQTRLLYAAENGRIAAEFDRRMLDEARKTAAARDAMMREMNHRVKNNLQTVQSLIRLRVRQGDGSVAEEIIQRVGAVSDVHDLLYTAGVQGQINFRDFLVRIAANESLFPPERPVRPVCDLADLVIDTEQATPLALVVVELVTNAVKHAFPDQRAGTVTIRLRKEGGTAILEIADDGVGIRDNGRASGIRLVRAFVDQLGGELARESNDGAGTRWRLCFPVQRTAPADAEPVVDARDPQAVGGGEVTPAT